MYNVKRSSDFMQIFTSLTLHHFYIQNWEDIEILGSYKESRLTSFLNSVFHCHCLIARLHLLHKTCWVESTLGSPTGQYDRMHIAYTSCYTGSDPETFRVGCCGSNDFNFFSLILENFFICYKKQFPIEQYQFI